MKKARETAREVALLGISQLPANPERLEAQQLQDVVLAAVRTLAGEVQDAIETAATEVQRGSDRLLASEIRAPDLQTARTMVREAIELTETAINRLGIALELPETIHLANQEDVRTYALEILSTVSANRLAIDELLSAALVDWQIERLPRIDRDIMRIAVAEIMFLGLPEQVGINEAIELAKRYSGEEGYRFINGVLRRAVEKMKPESSLA
ncbi:transcription antitermination factor NusB [Kamptonema sp. UHCC 0994]|uniref:transcription antitermination factor NusB n=1 Tax=Kamptonema sp. UHCC 0994 TaxID=3031329 RepID=UPI0023B8956F|nr:transcription antitermination factor NusB [Kamptonema sp. UHCC 0994]MDF0552367.1 transcription antitermination factor NusB [Kamptonema sp. UHCC 0994]